VKVHQMHPELVRIGRKMRAVRTRFAFGHRGLPSNGLSNRAFAL
jgi:hypothetical protein